MKKGILLLIFILLMVGLPLAGVYFSGLSVEHYWEFPPLTRYIHHAQFSWVVFALLLLLGIGVGLLFILQIWHGITSSPPLSQKRSPSRFPWWGMLGFVLVSVGWCLAWNRFPWFEVLQAHTFLVLWFGYILLINGVTFYREGRCLLTHKTGFFLLLFPFSALFWWFFEYLNRFVQNWYYVGVEDFSTAAYIVHASLAFSTVLPAVMSTEELLGTFSRLVKPLQSSFCLHLRRSSWLVGVGLLLCFGLFGIGVWPDYLFAALWLSPLFMVLMFQHLLGQKTVLDFLVMGDWRPVWLPALAALCCGFFWEMWNVKSYAHWVHSIPFVERFYIFEMPILGYLGYLPFGLECRGIAELLKQLLDD